MQNCWNCGRRAQETCSGCNVARYCGSFCQHKDWENHHKVCGPDLKSRIEISPQVIIKPTNFLFVYASVGENSLICHFLMFIFKNHRLHANRAFFHITLETSIEIEHSHRIQTSRISSRFPLAFYQHGEEENRSSQQLNHWKTYIKNRSLYIIA